MPRHDGTKARREAEGERRVGLSRCLVLLLLCLIQTATARADGWRTVEEHWYEFLINGTKAGWMSESVLEQEQTKLLRTVVESELSIERGPQAMRVTSRTEFDETPGGRPVEVRSEQRQSSHTVRTRWVFQKDGPVVQTVTQAGRETTKTLPRPEGTWLTPAAAERFGRQRREAGAEEYTYRVLDPENGIEPIAVSCRRVGEGTHEFGDRELPVQIWSTTTDVLPIEITEHYSRDGHLVYQQMPMLGGTMEVRVAAREDAIRGGHAGPELMVQTFVRPDRPLRNVDRLRRTRLRLTATNGAMPPLPSAGAQRIVAGVVEGSVELDVDIDRRLDALEGEPSDQAFLEPSAMISSDHPLVVKLTRNVTRHLDADPRARAEAMRRRVHRHISRKELETAFASAAETALLRRGDCSEHAVLLCAMLRADGIPARVASGLVYVDQFAGQRDCFGWHMWTQALVDDSWVDLDATQPQPYHAGHVLVSTSSLADGSGSGDLAAMIMLMGNLEIAVVELGYGE